MVVFFLSYNNKTKAENRKKYLSAARLKPDEVIDHSYNDRIDQYQNKMRNPSFKNGSVGMSGILSHDSGKAFSTPNKHESAKILD